MGSDAVFASDCRQSVSAADVAHIVKTNEERAKNVLLGSGLPIPVPEPGIVCPKDAKHGRMLMSLKDGMLECGPCGFKQAAPK